MRNGVLKRAILDFRFYALKATPNRPVDSVGLGTPGILTHGSVTLKSNNPTPRVGKNGKRYLSAFKAVYDPYLSALYSCFAYSVLSTWQVDAF